MRRNATPSLNKNEAQNTCRAALNVRMWPLRPALSSIWLGKISSPGRKCAVRFPVNPVGQIPDQVIKVCLKNPGSLISGEEND